MTAKCKQLAVLYFAEVTRTSASIQLQPRDLELFRGLFESRIMTLRHIAAIHFDDHAEAAKKRVQNLKAAGYIRERQRGANEPAIVSITERAFTALQTYGLLESYPQATWTTMENRIRVSQSTIQHEIEVLDVRAALTSAVLKTPAQISEFRTWPALYQFTARREDVSGAPEVLVKPDGYIRIAEPFDGALYEHTFFLEVDRSTETQDTLAQKGACYTAYFKAGGYAEWLGKTRAEFRDFPFCVLMVLKNAERRNNTAERMLQLNTPIYRQVWLTTWKEIIADPLGNIWVQPREYLEVTKGTAFDATTEKRKGVYRRQVAREEMVERTVMKRTLL